MVSYLLDTNVCIHYLNSSNNPIFERLNLLTSNDVFLCDIVKFELYYGAYSGRIRAELNKKGTPIGVYDLQIASIALANNLVLVTHNIGEFSRVEGLQYEDWE